MTSNLPHQVNINNLGQLFFNFEFLNYSLLRYGYTKDR